MKQILLPDKPDKPKPVVTEAQLLEEEVRITKIACALFERFINKDVSIDFNERNIHDLDPVSPKLTIYMDDDYIKTISEKGTKREQLSEIKMAVAMVALSISLILTKTETDKETDKYYSLETICPILSEFDSNDKKGKTYALSLVFENRENAYKLLPELRANKKAILTEIAGGQKALEAHQRPSGRA